MAATTRSWSILKTAGRALSDPASLFQTVDVSEIGKSRLIIFGEIHSVPSIIKVQAEIQRTMVQQLRMPSSAKLHGEPLSRPPPPSSLTFAHAAAD